jgi:hypothetical protein
MLQQLAACCMQAGSLALQPPPFRGAASCNLDSNRNSGCWAWWDGAPPDPPFSSDMLRVLRWTLEGQHHHQVPTPVESWWPDWADWQQTLAERAGVDQGDGWSCEELATHAIGLCDNHHASIIGGAW